MNEQETPDPQPLITAYRLIPLSGGRAFAMVDVADYDWLSQWTWSLAENKRRGFVVGRYAVRHPSSGKTVYMHREILGSLVQPGQRGDHRDRDGLNNRRYNLRPCTAAQNACNKRMNSGVSRFTGVAWRGKHGRWQAQIEKNSRAFNLGFFDSEEDAARAYDFAARIHHGEFACLNFPDDLRSEPPPRIRKPRPILLRCPNGHEYTPENTGIWKKEDGSVGRFCLICARGKLMRKLAREKLKNKRG